MKLTRIALIALFASVASLGLNAQTTPPTTPTTPTIPTAPTTPTAPAEKGGKGTAKKELKGPNENASATAKAVHEVIAKFQDDRAAYLASRKEILERAKAATGDAKKVILEELRMDSQARESEERTLGKQIREELKSVRDSRKTGS